MAERTGLNYWSAELFRRRGELLLQRSAEHATEAKACFDRAIAIAQAQQAQSLLLRAEVSKVRVFAANGPRSEALEHIALIYNAFTQGADTEDLRATRRLID